MVLGVGGGKRDRRNDGGLQAQIILMQPVVGCVSRGGGGKGGGGGGGGGGAIAI